MSTGVWIDESLDAEVLLARLEPGGVEGKASAVFVRGCPLPLRRGLS